MYKQVLEKVNHRHLIYYILFILVVFLVTSIVTYIQGMSVLDQILPVLPRDKAAFVLKYSAQQRTIFVADFIIILLVGIILDMVLYVAKRDGFRDGYERGLHVSSSKVK